MTRFAIPLSLYIHLPWCARKCPYCDFNSHQQREPLPEKDYIEKLLIDLQTHQAHYLNRPIHSIFIGGGTPSLFSANSYQLLFNRLHNVLDLPPGIEITMEANPGSSEQERFYGYQQAGINRLSLGVQSWSHQKLQDLGRIHNPEQARLAVEMAKKAGLVNFNIDIMHGLPNQNLAEALDDLKQTLDCQPNHISWYQLTLEPNTFFHRFPPALPSEDILYDIQSAGIQILKNAGYQNYEVSAFCLPEQSSKHNLNYWQFGDYIGIGAGAHSKITLNDGSIWRYWKIKNPKDYLSKDDLIAGKQPIIGDEILFEFLLNAFRLYRPIPFELIHERTGLSIDKIKNRFSRIKNKELIDLNDVYVATTELGKRFLNELLLEFLPKAP